MSSNLKKYLENAAMKRVPDEELLDSDTELLHNSSILESSFPQRKRARTLSHSMSVELEYKDTGLEVGRQPPSLTNYQVSNDRETDALVSPRFRSNSFPDTKPIVVKPVKVPPDRKPRRKVKVCEVEGCAKGARGGSTMCQRHGGGKRCSVPNCPRGSQGASDKCTSHGGGYRCKHPKCETGARGSSGFCSKHGGAVALSRKRESKQAAASTSIVKGNASTTNIPNAAASVKSNDAPVIVASPSIGIHSNSHHHHISSRSRGIVVVDEPLSILSCVQCRNQKPDARLMLYMLPCRHLIHAECAKALITDSRLLGLYCATCHAVVMSLVPLTNSLSTSGIVINSTTTASSEYWSTPDAVELLNLLILDDQDRSTEQRRDTEWTTPPTPVSPPDSHMALPEFKEESSSPSGL